MTANVHIPATTHLRKVILAEIARTGEVSSRKLRLDLADEGIVLAGPAFYQFMGQLIRDGLVTSRFSEELVRDLAIKETYYSLTDEGRSVMIGGGVSYDRRILIICMLPMVASMAKYSGESLVEVAVRVGQRYEITREEIVEVFGMTIQDAIEHDE